ncbi:MAG: DUF5719 family protein [Microbacteriaceae bacterium]|nr:DUF5719 family protein [Microbacteriaceae bacterium]
MPKTQKIARFAGRILAGTIVTACAVSGVIAAGHIKPNYPQVTPQALAANTASNSNNTIACSGAFAELGADQARSSVSIPRGSVAITSTVAGGTEIKREEGAAATFGRAFTAPASTPLVAAGSQALSSETLRGLAAHSCNQPATEQWLVGGSTNTGASSTVTVTNAGNSPATVTFTAYNDQGLVAGGTGAGVLVQPGNSRTVSVNGIAPASAVVALRVSSVGSPVVATLGTSEILTLTPIGIDTVTSQQPPSKQITILGVKSTVENTAGDAGVGAANVLALLSPEKSGVAKLSGLTKDGKTVNLGTVALTADKITQHKLENLPKEVTAIHITADVPIVGAARGSTIQSGRTDLVWFTPSPLISKNTNAAITVAANGKITLANPANKPASVTLTSKNDPAKTAKTELPANSAVTLDAPDSVLLVKTTGDIYAAVTIFEAQGAAAYPVQNPTQRNAELNIYTD